MKKFFLSLINILLVFVITGCGVNIKQEGNKIYTDVSKDEAYSFTSAALKTIGYKVTEESKLNYYIVATPEYNKTFQIEKADKTEVKAVITDSTQKNETVVSVLAYAQGNFDEKASEQIAADAVKEIIAELNKYGKFNASKEATQVYPVATLERVNDYVRAYFTQNNLPIQEADGAFNYSGTPDNTFNEGLKASVAAQTDETQKVTITVAANIQGNYDVNGNQNTVEQFVQKIMDYLEQYPVAEKGARHAYRYISLEKAFGMARAAAQDAGYTINNVDTRQLVLNARKNNINLVITLTTLNDNRAVNLTAYAEGTAGETKEALSAKLETELSNLVSALEKYQTSVTGEKQFISSNQNDVIRYVELSLRKLGYSYNTNREDLTIIATSKTDANRAHAIAINNLGSQGISVAITSLYNAKSPQALTVARAENRKLISALNEYDGKDLK
jgi:hypothetical protein